MDNHPGEFQGASFGQYLRTVRLSRRLTLDAVEEMTLPLAASVSKSHLSKIENGHAEPSFPRLYALSQIYGVPIASLAERFEIALYRESLSDDLAGRSSTELRREAAALDRQGRFDERLLRLDLLLERARAGQDTGVRMTRLRVRRISCLASMARWHSAKDECEDLLAERDLSVDDRARALHHLARCCYRMGKFAIARMAIIELEQVLTQLAEQGLMAAQLAGLRGNLCIVLGNARDALFPFREALERFEALHDDFEACRFRINYGVALCDCGRYVEAQQQLAKALTAARDAGYQRQSAYALHALGRVAFRLDTFEAAEPLLIESNQIARARKYLELVFCNCFYLWKIALSRQDDVAARTHVRTLRSYLSRIPDTLDEVREFRAFEDRGIQ